MVHGFIYNVYAYRHKLTSFLLKYENGSQWWFTTLGGYFQLP